MVNELTIVMEILQAGRQSPGRFKKLSLLIALLILRSFNERMVAISVFQLILGTMYI